MGAMAPRPPARRQVSRQRFLVRRVVVGVFLGLALLGVVRVLGGLLGGENGSASAPELLTAADPVPGTASDDGSTGADPSGADPSDVALALGVAAGDEAGLAVDGVDPADDAVEPGAEGDRGPRGPPTPADPARVLIVGDSDAGTFGPYLQQVLAESRVTETVLDYKVSSGLARPDFFDWQAELETKVPEFDPDIVVITFGGNDGQFLADRSGSSVVGQARPDADNSEWTAEYRRRVRDVVDYLSADGRTVIWVGIPNHVDPDVRFRMQVQDEAVKAELAEHPEVRFVDAWTRFAGRNGGFAEFLIDPRDGQGKPVRASDGFHLNRVGAEILAIDIASVVFDELRTRGAQI
jgi:uncharacterized protein